MQDAEFSTQRPLERGAWLVTRAGVPRILPARRLAASVLLRAIADVTRMRPARVIDLRPPPPAPKVAVWFASDATDWPFAFRNLCEILDLDPVRVRRAVGVGTGRHGVPR